MLTTLSVRNLALVEQARLEFGPGLNVITGETGAGKSVLISALRLLIGERADRSSIREGADMCSAEAVFELADLKAVNALLEDRGLPPCEENQLFIRRTVKSTTGGGQFVNDAPVSLNTLRDLGEILVDMHGPYDHQSLLRQDAQLDLLDAYGHTEKERAACGEWMKKIRAIDQERESLSGETAKLEEELDQLRYRIAEINEAAIQEGEEEELLREQQTAGHAQRILELGQGAIEALQAGEISAFDCVVAALRGLDALTDLLPEAESWQSEALDINARLQDLSSSMVSRMENIEADPSRLAWLDDRLALYARLRKKYGPTVPDVFRTLEDATARLQQLENREEQLAALDADRAKALDSLNQSALALHKLRRKAADEMAKGITAQLQDLGFPKGGFTIALNKKDPGADGIDDIEFTFAPNPGESERPLRAIASSGEIARVMLAVKTILAGHDQVPVLIFDEIDANVGGEMGHAIGKKLSAVGEHHQVIAITHLPQVAVFGRLHLAVAKQEKAGRTLTEVRGLSPQEREEEIARMLGGKHLTPVTLEHARALLAGTATKTKGRLKR